MAGFGGGGKRPGFSSEVPLPCVSIRFHAEWLAGRLTWLQGFLSHTSGAVRDAAGKLMGIAAIGLMDSLSAEKLIVQLVEVLGNGSADKKPKFEEIDGSLAALG